MASSGLSTIDEILAFEVFREDHDGVNHGFRVKLSNGDIDDVQANDPRLTREKVGTFLKTQKRDQVRKWVGVAKSIDYDVGTNRPRDKCVTKLMMWFDEAQGSVSSLNKGGQGCVSLPNTTAIPVLLQELTGGKELWVPCIAFVSKDVNADQTRNIALAQYMEAGFETKDGNFLYYGNPIRNWQCSVSNDNIACVTNNENDKAERAHVVFPHQITKFVSISPTCIVKVQGGNQIPVDPSFIHRPGFFHIDGDRDKPYLFTDLSGSTSYQEEYIRLRNLWEESANSEVNHGHALGGMLQQDLSAAGRDCIDLTIDSPRPNGKPPAPSVHELFSMQDDPITEIDSGDRTPITSPDNFNPGGVIEHEDSLYKSRMSVMPPSSPDQGIEVYVTLGQMQEHMQENHNNGLHLLRVYLRSNDECRATYIHRGTMYKIDIPNTTDDDERKRYFRCFSEFSVFLVLHKEDELALDIFWWYWPRILEEILTNHNDFLLVYNPNKNIGETQLDVIVSSGIKEANQELRIGDIVWTCDRGSLLTLKDYLSARFDIDSDEQKKAIDRYINLVEEIWGARTATALRDGTLAPRRDRNQLQPVGLGSNERHRPSPKRPMGVDPNHFGPGSASSGGSLSAQPGIHKDDDEKEDSPGVIHHPETISGVVHDKIEFADQYKQLTENESIADMVLQVELRDMDGNEYIHYVPMSEIVETFDEQSIHTVHNWLIRTTLLNTKAIFEFQEYVHLVRAFESFKPDTELHDSEVDGLQNIWNEPQEEDDDDDVDFHDAAKMQVKLTSMIAKRDGLNEDINRLKRKLEQAKQMWWNEIDQFAATISRTQEDLVMKGQQQAKRQRWNVLDKYAAEISRKQQAKVLEGRQEMRNQAEAYQNQAEAYQNQAESCQKQAEEIMGRLNQCK